MTADPDLVSDIAREFANAVADGEMDRAEGWLAVIDHATRSRPSPVTGHRLWQRLLPRRLLVEADQ